MAGLKVERLNKSFAERVIFSNVSFEISKGDKVGLIGPNGCGKTTLMRCLLGLEEADDGQVLIGSGVCIGYVEQGTNDLNGKLYDVLSESYGDVVLLQQEMHTLEQRMAAEQSQQTLQKLMTDYAQVMEKFEAADGYEYQNQIRKVAFGLGFSDQDLERDVQTFSGGQRTRIGLAKALIRRPDYLFLDEPTNHLDMQMVEWLEEFLAGYGGGLLIISHDRYFLDRVVQKIFELEDGVFTTYSGNYTVYLDLKAKNLEALQKAYDKQQVYIEKTEAFVRRYRAGVKARQARGRQSQLDRLERIVLPQQEDALEFAFPDPKPCAERVAEFIDVTAEFDQRTLFAQLSLAVRQGDRIALVGPNGSGKSTLLKMLVGQIDPAAGRIKIGSRVQIGYYAQLQEGLHDQNSVLDEIMNECNLGEGSARHYLGAFLFNGDDVFARIGDLSGGEKARVVLCKLLLTGANFLVLDEPTNHLDIVTKEAVEEALLNYPGTILTVSHDRYYLDKVVDCVLELEHGVLTAYQGNYSDYYRKKQLARKQSSQPLQRNAATAHTRKRNQPDPGKLIQKLETEITQLEQELTRIEELLNDPQNHQDIQQSQSLAEQYADVQRQLDQKMEQWLAADASQQEKEV